jgi:DNA-binding beta-propeller fold protein YncE
MPRAILVALVLCVLIVARSSLAADKIVLVAGGSGAEGGKAAEAKLDGPFGIDFDQSGNALLVEISGHRVLKIDRQGILARLAGTGQKGGAGDGGALLKCQFNGMHSLAVAKSGEIYVADTWNNRVRKIDPEKGTIAAFAGTGEKGYSGDGGPAEKATFGGIYCVALDPAEKKLVLTDLDNRRIRVVDLASGVVTTVAGNGEKGRPQDGADAKSSPLVDPRAAVMDSQGNLYILERSGNALRIVDSAGKIRTLIGDGRGGVTLKGPKHLCLNRDGSVIIADTENHRILRYTPRDGKTAILAGTGKKGTSGVGGPPLEVELNQPHGVTIGPGGGLYIVDSSNNRVLKIVRDADAMQ